MLQSVVGQLMVCTEENAVNLVFELSSTAFAIETTTSIALSMYLVHISCIGVYVSTPTTLNEHYVTHCCVEVSSDVFVFYAAETKTVGATDWIEPLQLSLLGPLPCHHSYSGTFGEHPPA